MHHPSSYLLVSPVELLNCASRRVDACLPLHQVSRRVLEATKLGEFLGALVAITSGRWLIIAVPYENTAWLIAASENSSTFLRPVLFLRQIDWSISHKRELFASLMLFVSPRADFVVRGRTHL